MFTVLRTDSNNPDFIELVKQLDEVLAQIDGEEHSFYNQFNKIDMIKHIVVAYNNGKPVGCGAIKEFAAGTMEVKRMYTLPQNRNSGIATGILKELEKWATEMRYENCILETGIRQPDAINLYKKNGYKITPNYGQYAGVENSLCFEKQLKGH